VARRIPKNADFLIDHVGGKDMAETLDARGLKCPLPVLKAKKALKPLAAGDTLTVLATDPSAPKDFEEFCAATGYGLVDSRADGGEFTIIVRKA
jgi:tRNA 2-thiouridine synthesizing protein A